MWGSALRSISWCSEMPCNLRLFLFTCRYHNYIVLLLSLIFAAWYNSMFIISQTNKNKFSPKKHDFYDLIFLWKHVFCALEYVTISKYLLNIEHSFEKQVNKFMRAHRYTVFEKESCSKFIYPLQLFCFRN